MMMSLQGAAGDEVISRNMLKKLDFIEKKWLR